MQYSIGEKYVGNFTPLEASYSNSVSAATAERKLAFLENSRKSEKTETAAAIVCMIRGFY